VPNRTSPEPRLTKLQLSVLQALWSREEATVAEVQDALAPERSLALTTVATILSRLEQRGIVAHRAEGRQYIYRARLDSDRVRRSTVGNLLQTVFHGDVTTFFSQLLDARDLTAEELARLQQLVRAKDADVAAKNAGGVEQDAKGKARPRHER
jgi:BlaI family transcriptional regulator, penicillinase repressor